MYKYLDLVDKNVLVSGASGSIGQAICAEYLNQGSQVYGLYKSNSCDLEALKASHPQGHRLHIIKCCLTDKDAVRQLCLYLAEHAKKIDVLVNNAGIVKDNLFTLMPIEDFSLLTDTNLIGMFRLTKEMLMLLRGSDSATIINVASIAALVPSIGQCNYSATKAAMLGFTRTLAAELAPRGVRVNAVAPGMIESKMVKKVSRTVVREVVSTIPLRRLGSCAEVANTIVFLSSSASSYIVGQTIVIDGGLVMR